MFLFFLYISGSQEVWRLSHFMPPAVFCLDFLWTQVFCMRSVSHANVCQLYGHDHCSPRQSYLMAACIKTIQLCPSPDNNDHLRMCWVKFSKKLSFSESLHSACSVFVSFFLFLRLVFEALKGLGAPCMSFFLLLFSVLFFIIIQQHFSVRANAFWTASFLPFQAGCHCCCLWAGCIYLGVIGVWMSEVMRCIHTWLLPSLRAWDRRGLAGLRLELYRTAVSSTQARMALSYPGGQTQSLGLIPKWGVCCLKSVCVSGPMSTCPVCVCLSPCICGWRKGKETAFGCWPVPVWSPCLYKWFSLCVCKCMYIRLSGCLMELKEDLWLSQPPCQPQTAPDILQSYLMISLTPPLSVWPVWQHPSDAWVFTCHLLPHILWNSIAQLRR